MNERLSAPTSESPRARLARLERREQQLEALLRSTRKQIGVLIDHITKHGVTEPCRDEDSDDD